MVRPPKTEAKTTEKTSKDVSAEEFMRTRDSVVTGLATLQSAIQDLSRAYIAHTNTVLLSGTTNPQDLLVLSNPLGQHGFAASRSLLHPGPAVGPGRLRKKAKRVHDPNAPKRPLTPYFLFMQHARHIIAEDLGGKASPGAVSTEGTRRWLAMPDDQKENWKRTYRQNLAGYRKAKAEYDGGPVDPHGAAAQLAAENGAVAAGDDDEDDEEGEDLGDVVEMDVDDVNGADLHSEPRRDRSAEEVTKTSSGRKSRQSGLDVVDRQPAVVHAPVKETEVLPPGMLQPSLNDFNEDESQSMDRKRKKRKPKAGPEGEVLDSDQVKPEKERRSKRKRKSEVVES